jgi:hypothetical protein
MANFWKISLWLFIHLFVCKVLFASFPSFFNLDSQLVLLEDSPENENSDESLDLDLVVDCLDDEAFLGSLLFFFNEHNNGSIDTYKRSIKIVHLYSSFKPPCAT